MSLQLNTTSLAGHLTRDPVCRTVNNTEVADFGLAINRKWKTDAGELKEEVTFVDITAWGKTATFIAQWGKKGLALFVEGRLKLEQWDDKDGQKRSKLKVIAERVQFVESANGGQRAAPSGDAAPAAKPTTQRPAHPGNDEPPF